VRNQSDQAFALQGVVLPRSVVAARIAAPQDGATRVLQLSEAEVRRTVALVWRDREPISSSGKAFLAAVRAMLDSDSA